MESDSPPPSAEPPRERVTLRWHDTHQAWTPCCRQHHIWTDSPSMIQEAKFAGVPDPVELVEPVEALFQGERTKIFPVKCTCGETYLAFIDIVNREKIERTEKDLLPYYPQIAEDKDLRKRYLEPRRRDVLISREEFARRVAAEKNQMVRAALMRRLDERGLGIVWTSTTKVARLNILS